MFLAHRKELIDQAFNKLAIFGVQAGVLMADDPRKAIWHPVQVASVQTLVRRSHKPKADLIVLDECHHAPADTYKEILACYPEAVILGLSATPCRGDDRGLSDLFEVMVSCPSVGSMMQRKDPATGKPYLVSTRVFAPGGVDPSKLHVRAGEYVKSEVAEACDKPKLIGDIVAEWLKHAEGRSTIVFSGGIPASKKLVAKFIEAGVKAEHLDGTTEKLDREAILERLNSGVTTVVSNMGVLTEGFDCPRVSCVVLARPTKSMGLYLQCVGRALRPYPGKSDCLILDHVNATRDHGFVDEDREWSLAAGVKRAPKEKVTSVATCKMCFFTFAAGPRACPNCGAVIPKQSREIIQVDGALEELHRAQKEHAVEEWRQRVTDEQKMQRFLEFRREARDKGWKRTAPFARYIAVFRERPLDQWWGIPI
jgi:superfamily II DNA or RNA helicase